MMRGETRRELVYRPESRPAPNPLVRVGSEDPEQQLGSSVASSPDPLVRRRRPKESPSAYSITRSCSQVPRLSCMVCCF